MGFNIIGVALNKKFDNKVLLAQEIGIGEIELQESDALWEDAMSSYSMGDEDVFFTEGKKGTLITVGVNIDFTQFNLRAATTKYETKGMVFAIGDTVGIYSMALYIFGKCARYVNFEDGMLLADKGPKIELESGKEFGSDLIFELIGKYLGTSFWDIENDHPSIMFKRK